MWGPWHNPDPDASDDYVERDEFDEAFMEWANDEADRQALADPLP